MFPDKVLRDLATRHREALKKLKLVEDALNGRLWNMEEAVHALVLSVASGQPLLLVGPPGTAKSRLVRDFCTLIGLVNPQHRAQSPTGAYFEYLLTPFTEPGELFGFYDIRSLHGGSKPNEGLKRLGEGRMLQHARVVFLDEVFNASSAILNSILAIVNERIFHDRGEIIEVRLQCLFGATNRVPETPELEALFDRFVLRCHVENAPAKQVAELVRKGWIETYREHQPLPDGGTLLADLARFREDIRTYSSSDGSGGFAPALAVEQFGPLTYMVEQARDYRLSEMSNRRLIQLVYLMLVSRVYRAATENLEETQDLRIGHEELALLPAYFLDRRDREAMDKMQRYPSSSHS